MAGASKMKLIHHERSFQQRAQHWTSFKLVVTEVQMQSRRIALRASKNLLLQLPAPCEEASSGAGAHAGAWLVSACMCALL